jgi:hypothetical protein
MDLHLLNRAGQWYYTKSYTDSGQLVPIEDMQHIQDRCDERISAKLGTCLPHVPGSRGSTRSSRS